MAQTRSIQELPVVALPEDFQSEPGPFLARMYAQHGPIFRSRRLGGADIVYLVGAEANRSVLGTHRAHVSNEGGWKRTEQAVQIFGQGLTFMDGVEHGEHRRALAPAFTPRSVEASLPMMDRIIREATAHWASRGEVDVYQEAHRITFDIAAGALVGFSSRPQIDRLRELYLRMFWLEMQALTTVAPAARAEWMDRQLTEIRIRMRDLMEPEIERRRRQPTEDALGRLCAPENGRPLSNDAIIAEINTLLLAGHITTTSLTTWLLYLLLTHPDYLQRVREEQRRLLGDAENPSGDQIRQMDVLDNAMKETERLYPPIAHLPRTVSREFMFHDCHLPAGTFFFLSLAGGHRIRDAFAAPEGFDPDRFAAPRQEHLKTPYSLVGFSGGPRVCLGISFARAEVKAIASRVLRQFTLRLSPGQNIIPLYHPMNVPLDGIKVQVRPADESRARPGSRS